MLRYLHIPSRDFSSFAESRTIVLMHGFGASAENLLGLLLQIDAERKYNWILPLAPYTLHDPETDAFLGYAWFPRDRARQLEAFSGSYFQHLSRIDGDELQEGTAALAYLIETLRIPYHTLVIGGFSQGAMMVAEFLLHTAHRCVGALLFSGALIAEERWNKSVVAESGIPFLQTHGRADDVLSFQSARALHELLLRKGFRGTLRTFEGGHSVPQQGLSDTVALLSQWYLDRSPR